MTQPFTHLHVHSQYSLLDGQASIPSLVDRAVSLGMRGLALTDHGNMFGIKEFFNYVGKVNDGLDQDKRIKPILGCEMYVARDRLTDRGDKSDNGYHLIVLAKNLTGYHNLVKLVSKAWTEGYYYKPRTDRHELELHHEGLIICSACLGGEIPQYILNGDLPRARQRAIWFKEIFGDDFYLELQSHRTLKQRANTETFEHQKAVNAVLVEMSRELGIKLVATNDVHFTAEADADAHDCLICVSMQRSYGDPQRMHYTKQEWLKSTEEMAAAFAYLPEGAEAMANTAEILDKVETYSINNGPIMPNFEIPAEFGSEEEYRSRLTEQDLFDEFTRDENGKVVLSDEEARKKIERLGGYEKLYRIKFEADYLKHLTMIGARRRYAEPLSEEVTERLNFELHIMKTMGFPGYFLIVQDFISEARHHLGVSVGPGRGSAAGSVVAYCLGITDIDPLKYDLLFERFLNPDRISLPDIDVDFDDDGRYVVLDYVTRKYGKEKVAHIITYGTMATKTSIKDVAKAMEMKLPEANRLAKLVPDRIPDSKVNFRTCVEKVPEFRAETQSPDPLVRTVLDFASRLEGNVRNTGVHACGVIIGRDDITDTVPVSTAKDVDGKNIVVTQYEGSVIEETGLIKMDFLGLKTLSIIKEALANIKQTKGIDLDIDNIPLDDPKTFELYCTGATTGTFQFESPGMQQSLRELHPTKFEDLIAMNALYRPGPMAYIPQFIARKHGVEPIVYDIPIMEKYLSETYGITVYQEQVMLLSRLLANFTRGESDKLRKAMGKKKLAEMAKLKVKFMAEGQKNGYEEKVLEKIWSDWTEFAKYAFNKSHATCYSWVAYQTGYLKANYPAEYMAGVLSRNLTMPDKLSRYMDECRAMHLVVKGPDINESLERFIVNDQGEIRFGLGGIKGLGTNAVKAIVDERHANGPFKDVFDLVERVNLTACNRSAVEALALSGALDSFGHPREMYVSETAGTPFSDILVKYGQRFQQDRDSTVGSLFGDLEPIETARPPLPSFDKWEPLRLLDAEKKLVLMYLSAHPLDPYYMELTYGCTKRCNELKELDKDGEEITFGGLVTAYDVRTTAKNRAYGVMRIEDYSGSTEIRMFGSNHEKAKVKAVPGVAIRVKARVGEVPWKPGQYELSIGEIEYLEDVKGKVANAIFLDIPVDANVDTLTPLLQKYCSQPRRSGRLHFRLYNPVTGQRVNMVSRKRIDICRDLMTDLEEFPGRCVVLSE